jgi:hypothetical protein
MTTPSSDLLWDWLPGGFCPRRDAVLLALRCEDDGIRLRVVIENGVDTLRVDGELSSDTLTELRRLKPHLIPVLKFRGCDRHLWDDSRARPQVGPVVVSKAEPNTIAISAETRHSETFSTSARYSSQFSPNSRGITGLGALQ